MYCRACFANLPDTAVSCGKCGRDPRLAPPTAASPAPTAARVTGEAWAAAARRGGPGQTADPRRRRRSLAVGGLGVAAGLALAALLVRPGLEEGAAPASPGSHAARATRAALPAVEFEPAVALPAAPQPGRGGPAADRYAAAYEAYQRGDFASAAAALREGLGVAPGHPDLVTALATTLEAAGGRRLEAGDHVGAAAALTEAAALDPERGQVWKSLGYAQLALGDTAAARESLERAHRLRPTDAQARLLLATALYQGGDTAGAAATLRAGGPDGDPRYAALLEKVEREARAEQGFARAESRHFTVSFEGGGTSGQAGYLVSLLLEDAYHRVGADLDFHPTEPVHAVLYPAERFRDVTRSPAWAGAIYDGKIRLPVGGLTAETDLLARTIAHEYTHAVVHRLSRGRAPVWLNEGLAMLSEAGGAGDAADLERQFRAYVKGGGHVTSLRALEGSFGSLNDAQARVAYAHALAATNHLVRAHGKSAARRLLDRLGEGRSLEEAIRETLYVSYDDLDRAWVESLR